MKEDWETNPPVDMEEALEIVDGDDELLKEIFDDFLNRLFICNYHSLKPLLIQLYI